MRRGARGASPTSGPGALDAGGSASSPKHASSLGGPSVGSVVKCVSLRLLLVAAAAIAVGVAILTFGSSMLLPEGPTPMPLHTQVLVLTGIALVHRAGREISAVYHAGAEVADAAKEPVTNADLVSNIVLSELARPEIGVISEEGVSDEALPYIRSDAMVVAYVDPLDATQEFTEQLTQYVSISICFTRCGQPIVSIMYFPFTERTYVVLHSSVKRTRVKFASATDALREMREQRMTAFSVPGLTADGCACSHEVAAPRSQPMLRAPVGDAAPPRLNAPLRIIVSRSHFKNESRSSQTGLRSLQTVLALLQQTFQGAVVTRAGGAGYKLAAVYDDDADLYIHDGPIRMWDVCTGVQLLRSAQLPVSDWTGQRHSFCMPPDARAFARIPVEERAATPRLAGPPYDKRSFAVMGIVAARTRELHEYVLRVIFERD